MREREAGDVRFVIISISLYNACVRGGGAEWNEARQRTQGEDITNANHLISMLIETPTHLYLPASSARSLSE